MGDVVHWLIECDEQLRQCQPLVQTMQHIVTDLDSLFDDDRLVMNMDKRCQHLSEIKNVMENVDFLFSLTKQLTPICAAPNNYWFVFIGLFLLCYASWGSLVLVAVGMWTYHDIHAYDQIYIVTLVNSFVQDIDLTAEVL